MVNFVEIFAKTNSLMLGKASDNVFSKLTLPRTPLLSIFDESRPSGGNFQNPVGPSFRSVEGAWPDLD